MSKSHKERYMELMQKRDSRIDRTKELRDRRAAIGEPDDAYYADMIDVIWGEYDRQVTILCDEIGIPYTELGVTLDIREAIA